jgi:hypothetical protein
MPERWRKSTYAQDIFYDTTLRQNRLKDQEVYRSSETGCCVTAPHLHLTAVDRPGIYQY